MSPVQTGAPHVEEAPSPTRSLKWRAIAAPVLRNKSAMVAVFVLAVFVFLAVFGQWLISRLTEGREDFTKDEARWLKELEASPS